MTRRAEQLRKTTLVLILLGVAILWFAGSSTPL